MVDTLLSWSAASQQQAPRSNHCPVQLLDISCEFIIRLGSLLFGSIEFQVLFQRRWSIRDEFLLFTRLSYRHLNGGHLSTPLKPTRGVEVESLNLGGSRISGKIKKKTTFYFWNHSLISIHVRQRSTSVIGTISDNHCHPTLITYNEIRSHFPRWTISWRASSNVRPALAPSCNVLRSRVRWNSEISVPGVFCVECPSRDVLWASRTENREAICPFCVLVFIRLLPGWWTSYVGT